jgi:hypothetical protein
LKEVSFLGHVLSKMASRLIQARYKICLIGYSPRMSSTAGVSIHLRVVTTGSSKTA